MYKISQAMPEYWIYLCCERACFAEMIDKLTTLGNLAADVRCFDSKQQCRRAVANVMRLQTWYKVHVNTQNVTTDVVQYIHTKCM